MSSVSILNPICRGILGYVSYMATCSQSEVYSEYLLYEPISRIAQSKGYRVRHEVPVGVKRNKQEIVSASISNSRRVSIPSHRSEVVGPRKVPAISPTMSES